MSGMQDCDISEMLQHEHYSQEQMQMNHHQIDLLNLENINSYDILEADDMQIELQDDPYHSYKLERKQPIIDLNSSSDNPRTFTEEDFEDRKIEPNDQNILGDTDIVIEEIYESKKEEKEQEKNRKNEDKIYSKNIVGYEAKKTIKLMFSNHTKYLSKKCKTLGVKFRQFKKIYKPFENILSGPVNLKKMFDIETNTEEEVKMKKLFTKTFVKILRKQYLIYTLKLGKMKQHEVYIQKKNKQLLYFPFRDQML